jgi:hypothetical protein
MTLHHIELEEAPVHSSPLFLFYLKHDGDPKSGHYHPSGR